VRIFEVSTGCWSSGPLRVLTTRRDRRLGLTPSPGPFGALIRGRSIHTFGMTAPIGVIALDAKGVVRRARIVPPSRAFFAPRARWIVETPGGAVPEVGETAVVACRGRASGAAGSGDRILGGCPEP